MSTKKLKWKIKWKDKQRKIIRVLIIGAAVLFVGLMVEFVLHRYSTNRSVIFRTENSGVQIYQDRKWQDFIISGITAVPDEIDYSGDSIIEKDEYARWFKEINASGINVVRVFTIQPPAFYQAFFEYNMLTNKPLYLLHGIDINENNISSYQNAYAEELLSDFFAEIKDTVDVIHGKIVIKPRAGRASGTYNLDVAPYVMGYFFNANIDSGFVNSTNEKNTNVIGFEGDYIYTENASPYEAWFAGVGNYIISYEQDHYKGPPRLMGWQDWSRAAQDQEGEDDAQGYEVSWQEHILTTEKYNTGILTIHNEYSEGGNGDA